MENLSNLFAEANDYGVTLPTKWHVEQDLDPEILAHFSQIARTQNVTVYEAFAQDAKVRLQTFLQQHGNLKATVSLSYLDNHRTQASLRFRHDSPLYDLKKSLNTIFADVPLSEEATQTNVGSRMHVIYPSAPCDFGWDC